MALSKKRRRKVMREWIKKHSEHLTLEGKSPLTVEGYAIDLIQFTEFMEINFPGTPPDKIDVTQIRGFLRDLSTNGVGNRSLARKIASLSSWFAFLRLHKVRTDNPMLKIRRPKYEKKLPRFFTEEEMELLLSIPDTSDKYGVRNKAMLELLYSCGLRLMELANLKLSDLDSRRKLIKVLGKGNKERMLPVGQKAMDSMNEYLKIRGEFVTDESSNRIFLTSNGRDFDAPQLKVILGRYIDLIARSKGYSPHTIRHSFATHMLNRGADIRSIQELMGHAQLSSTEIYTHLSLEDIKEAYEKGHPRSGE